MNEQLSQIHNDLTIIIWILVLFLTSIIWILLEIKNKKN